MSFSESNREKENREVRLWVGERAAKETKCSDLELGKEEQKFF